MSQFIPASVAGPCDGDRLWAAAAVVVDGELRCTRTRLNRGELNVDGTGSSCGKAAAAVVAFGKIAPVGSAHKNGADTDCRRIRVRNLNWQRIACGAHLLRAEAQAYLQALRQTILSTDVEIRLALQ